MLGYSGANRAETTRKMLDFVNGHEWGLMLLDEVQVVPANNFKKITENIKAHCKLGLTATLVREDGKIDDLHYLIGPKLYEANWIDLQERGYLARVQCIEVWCEMTARFYEEYFRKNEKKGHHMREALYFNNPNKYMACDYLRKVHEERGDKIIIFCDHIFALKIYAKQQNIPYISGEVGERERNNIISQFRDGTEINCIIFSRVGDTSIDIPNANVIIQVASHAGSRR
jgi:DNA excision repair protein ERCC-3